MRRSFLDEQYRPTGEGILKESRISVACGIAGWILYGILVFLSYKSTGNGGRILGLMGWVSVLLAGAGIYYAYESMTQPGGKISVKLAGMIVSAALAIYMIIIFISGF